MAGLRIIREHVAQFISKRDGYEADTEDIYLTSGGAQGIQVLTGSTLSFMISQAWRQFGIHLHSLTGIWQAVIQGSSCIVRTCETHGRWL